MLTRIESLGGITMNPQVKREPVAIRNQRGRLLHFARSVAADACAGAICGLLFGMVYAGFEVMLHAGPERFLWIGGGFALCGGAAGSLLGVSCLVASRESATSTLDCETVPDDRATDRELVAIHRPRRDAAGETARARCDRRRESRFPAARRRSAAAS